MFICFLQHAITFICGLCLCTTVQFRGRLMGKHMGDSLMSSQGFSLDISTAKNELKISMFNPKQKASNWLNFRQISCYNVLPTHKYFSLHFTEISDQRHVSWLSLKHLQMMSSQMLSSDRAWKRPERLPSFSLEACWDVSRTTSSNSKDFL